MGIDQFIGEVNYINQGIGTQLIREFVNQLFIDPAIQKVIIDVDPSNHRAIRCYQKVGFKLVGKIDTPDGLAVFLEIEQQNWVWPAL